MYRIGYWGSESYIILKQGFHLRVRQKKKKLMKLPEWQSAWMESSLVKKNKQRGKLKIEQWKPNPDEIIDLF